MNKVDLEEHHEREEVDIEALIRNIEGEAQHDRDIQEESPRGAVPGNGG